MLLWGWIHLTCRYSTYTVPVQLIEVGIHFTGWIGWICIWQKIVKPKSAYPMFNCQTFAYSMFDFRMHNAQNIWPGGIGIQFDSSNGVNLISECEYIELYCMFGCHIALFWYWGYTFHLEMHIRLKLSVLIIHFRLNSYWEGAYILTFTCISDISLHIVYLGCLYL